MRQWLAELAEAVPINPRVAFGGVRALDEERFLMLREVVVEGATVAPHTVIVRLSERGLIVDPRSYLSEEDLLPEDAISLDRRR